VVSEHFDAGWRATADGKPVPVVRADEVLLGVPVPSSAHLVELRFWPVGFTAGLWICFATIAALAAGAFAGRRVLSPG
jgi:uncharacterized membrane protein YfhO